MSNTPKTYTYKSLTRLATRLRDDLNNQDFVLLYAYNSTGKTRLSMTFKDAGKRKHPPTGDTLYFNAYTEDLFHWDNDLQHNSTRHLKINAASRFFSGFQQLALEQEIAAYLRRYANLDFDIDYNDWTISFSRPDSNHGKINHIKVSRGEENIFIWSLFLAICQVVIDELDQPQTYPWVNYLYIDDPISSLDDNNAIAVASDLAQLLRRGQGRLKTVISSHHGLFFNVMCNELKKTSHKKYFLHWHRSTNNYTLRATDDTPFFHHVAILAELQQAAHSGKLYTHHFNMLRNVLEKTASFFGFNDFSDCIDDLGDAELYARALNLLSHGNYSIYQPREMVEDNKALFRSILHGFLQRYRFQLPDLP